MNKVFFVLFLFFSDILLADSSNDNIDIVLSRDFIEKKPLTILFVLHEFPKYNQPFILNQITGLIDLGHNIHIYANNKKDIHVASVVGKYNLLEKTYFRELPQDFKSFDIIYCQFGLDGYVGLALKKRYGLSGKIVTCFRGDDISTFLFSDFKGKKSCARGPFEVPCGSLKMYDELFRNGDYFLPVCQYFVGKLKTLGCNSRKITVHHSAIDVSNFEFKKRVKIKKKPINIVSVGRLVPLKGMEFVLRAFEQLKVKNKQEYLKLFIVGDGPIKSYLIDLAHELKIENYVVFTGSLPHEKVKEILYNSHIFVLPSVTPLNGTEEGIPNVLMEAMATGMPVVSTRHSGISELIYDGQTGFLVEEREISALASVLHSLLQNSDQWVNIGRKARRYIKHAHNILTENIKLEHLFYRLVTK